MEIIEAGSIGYEEGLKLQQEVWQQVLSNQRGSTIILCEHPPVYTLGKSANSANLLINKAQLEKVGASVFETDRGGDITFHGPGQLVGYPIIRLEDFNLGVRRYVDLLEDALIDTCSLFDIKTTKIDGLTGIWLTNDNQMDRKIAAIGIKVSRGITMHGFALNINTDLNYFNFMIPCGIANKQVTSIYTETAILYPIEQISNQFVKVFQEKLNV